MTQISLLVEIAWKGTAILAAAFLAAVLLRRASAATRHFLWTEALAGLVLLPVAIAIAPHWTAGQLLVPGRVAGNGDWQANASTAHTVLVVRGTSVQPSTRPWLWLWAAGCALAAMRFAYGTARTRSILRRAKPAGYAQGMAQEIAGALGVIRDIAVLEAADVPSPLAWGILRPAVVLPRIAADWPETRLRTVLWHELAHIRRHDLLAQALGQVACCLYWFQPLAWAAARRLRQEREAACDDAVLAAGIPPHEYATDLLDLARGLTGRRRAWADAPAMADACDLESRVRALFDHTRNRRPLGKKTAWAMKATIVAVLLPLASVVVQAQAGSGSLAGVVVDPSGARVPGTRVTANHQGGANKETTRCNAAGEYRFNSIPAGEYVLEFASAGFALTRVNASVVAGQAARVDGTLELGAVSEAITVTGQKPPTVAPNIQGTPQRIRVGGNVQPVKLLRQVKPEYPADLQQLGVQGTVVIRAVISKDGEVLSPRVVSAGVDPRLAQLALDAVKQWRYQPSLLNGQPVETATTVTIDFALDAHGE